MVSAYEDGICPLHSMSEREMLIDIVDTYGGEKVKAAIRAAIRANARRLAYVEGCLKKWANGDIRAPVTLSAEEKAARDRQRAEEKERYEAAERERVFREYGVVVNESA